VAPEQAFFVAISYFAALHCTLRAADNSLHIRSQTGWPAWISKDPRRVRAGEIRPRAHRLKADGGN